MWTLGILNSCRQDKSAELAGYANPEQNCWWWITTGDALGEYIAQIASAEFLAPNKYWSTDQTGFTPYHPPIYKTLQECKTVPCHHNFEVSFCFCLFLFLSKNPSDEMSKGSQKSLFVPNYNVAVTDWRQQPKVGIEHRASRRLKRKENCWNQTFTVSQSYMMSNWGNEVGL